MNKKKIIAWISVLSWLLVIFFFSSQNGSSSSNLSNGVVKLFENLFPVSLNPEFLSLCIRKCAHFFEYFILGLLVCNLVKQYQNLGKKEYLWIFIFCFLYACSDEFHQMFVGGRSPQILDILIDSLGSLTGIFLIFYLKRIRERKKL